MQGHVIMWPFFEECFLGRYFPYDAQERKQGEFERLVQGLMTVDEYLAKFNELAKFAHFRIAMPTSAFLASKFRRGLNEEIADKIVGAASRDFGTLVQQCRDIEDVCVVSKAKKAKVSDVKGTEVVAVDPNKIEAMLDWERPKTVTEMRSFLGLELKERLTTAPVLVLPDSAEQIELY
ncbi:uncharacterized protein LOC133285399 [Gastrolobium bilobum]|uniref:uncharacterized protein LOC133285399 n=1 Tax=Gastrolobium bilobum TaxID=150636 RepID=UPI002AB0919D|nr:uncharacterized protein LOC133285399 [Gastrolobium bilobum]